MDENRPSSPAGARALQAQSPAFASRLKRELTMLERSPSPGVSVWPKDDRVDTLCAVIRGVEGTPYEKGQFHLEVNLSARYPFEPPRVRFVTPIYHPNIDSSGRICLNILNMPPKGAWKPALNIATVLKSVQLLMTEPNPDDPLMVEISEQFKSDRQLFTQEARLHTQKHACGAQPSAAKLAVPHREAGESNEDAASSRGGAAGGAAIEDEEQAAEEAGSPNAKRRRRSVEQPE